jgi:TM2 domain-containing membrane protein YozV
VEAGSGGEDLYLGQTHSYHNVGIATVLAIILPGAGQFFNRQAVKGTAILLLATFCLIVFAASPRTYGYAAWGAVAFWVVGIFDAGLIAGRIVRGEPVSAWRWF